MVLVAAQVLETGTITTMTVTEYLQSIGYTTDDNKVWSVPGLPESKIEILDNNGLRLGDRISVYNLTEDEKIDLVLNWEGKMYTDPRNTVDA